MIMTKSVWKRVQELQAIGIGPILKDYDLKSEYIRLHKKIFLSNLCVSCNATIKHTFTEFSQLTKTKIKIMKDRKYKFKDSTVLWVEKDRVHYTNDNLTDEIAERLLKENSGYAKFFEGLPKDWEEQLGKEGTAKTDKPISKMNTDELQVEVAKLEGITIEEIKTTMKMTKKNIVKVIKDWTPPVPAKDEAPVEEKKDGDEGGDDSEEDGQDGEEDSAITLALKQMDEAGLQKHAGDNVDKFPDWEKYTLKEELLTYMLEIV